MTTLQKLFNSDECTIFYNMDLHIVQSRWKGVFVKGEALHNIFNELIKALEITKTSTIIADARKMLIIPEKDQRWTINDWYPRAVKAGFRYQGLILSKNTFNELTIQKIAKEYDDSIVTTKYFRGLSEALTWAKEIGRIGSQSPMKRKIN